MSSYKLTYFNIRGRAETTRVLFALGDLKYEDLRLNEDGWKALKPNTPFGQVPLLEVDGQTFCQSHAIERLVAKRIGIYGNDDLEQAKTDMIVDTTEDMYKLMTKMFTATNEEEKVKAKKEFLEELLPPVFENFQKLINDDGFFITNKIMWADVAIYIALENLSAFGGDISGVLPKYPKLKALQDKVGAHPKIAKWVKERPVTEK